MKEKKIMNVLALAGLPLLLFLIPIIAFLIRIFSGKSINNPKYAPVLGTVFHQLFYFNRLYDHQTEVARKHSTFRLLGPGQSEIYTTDLQNIEHVLKTNFDKYAKGKYNQDVVKDLFGTGIFAVDGEKWRQQRKVASFEFSTRVLRDFSCTVFRRSAIKLVRKVHECSLANKVFDMQVIKSAVSMNHLVINE